MADAFSAIAVRTDTDGDVVVGIATGQTVGVSGTVNVNITNASVDVSVIDPLPAGTNVIGNVGINGTADVNITNSSLNVAVTSALPTGANTIGSVNIAGSLPTGSNTIGSISSIVNALPAGTNTIGSIASIVNALPAGTNIIGKVEVVDTSGTVVNETIPTSGNVVKNGGTSTVNSTAIPNGKTAELRQIVVSSSVAMKCVIRTDNTITQTNEAVTYIPAGGGQQIIPFINNAVPLVGTVAGENFDVVFTNLDTKNDAEAHVTFTYVLEP